MMPFCILSGAMTCYLALSRRLGTGGCARRRHFGVAVHRAARWQFDRTGIMATTAYNPISANLRELSKRMERKLFGSAPAAAYRTRPASGSIK